MTGLPIASARPVLTNGPQAPSQREQLQGAAQQFEALLLRQMLASARTHRLRWQRPVRRSEGRYLHRNARRAALPISHRKSGQLGFATTIEKQLARFLPKDNA